MQESYAAIVGTSMERRRNPATDSARSRHVARHADISEAGNPYARPVPEPVASRRASPSAAIVAAIASVPRP
jgi:hypothetical protein